MPTNRKRVLSLKPLVWFFALFFVICVPIRVYQMLNLLEAENGFYKRTDFTVPLLSALLVLVSLMMVVWPILSGQNKSYKLSGKRPLLAYCSFFLSIGLAVNIYQTVINISQILDLTSSPERKMVWVLVVQSIFAFFSALYFIIFGLRFLGKKINLTRYGYLALSPVLWAITRLLQRFMRKINYARVSELMLELIMLAFLMLFIIAFARIHSGVITDNTINWKLFSFGLPCAFFALLYSVTRFGFWIAGQGSLLDTKSPPELCDLVLGMFILVYLISHIYFNNIGSKSDEHADFPAISRKDSVEDDSLSLHDVIRHFDQIIDDTDAGEPIDPTDENKG